MLIPHTASDKIQQQVTQGLFPDWDIHPQNATEWKNWVNQYAEQTKQQLPLLCEQLGVSYTSKQIGGVNVFEVKPTAISSDNKNRVLLHFHGGGYVLNPGEAALPEAIMMAAFANIAIISVDYRMPPDFPFPAAIDDAFAVYQEMITHYPADKLAVFGTSTGGGITLALMLKLKQAKLPLPAAIGVGTPWSDMSKTGDSYFTHEKLDNLLVSYDGWLGDAAKLYANGVDLKNPLLSPIYGDLTDFPPTLLIAGTRDLFLSNTIRMHLKLRQAGNIADLVILEGVSHSQYLISFDMPEAETYFSELEQFFSLFLSQ